METPFYALSRIDNMTMLCPSCGNHEGASHDFYPHKSLQEQITYVREHKADEICAKEEELLKDLDYYRTLANDLKAELTSVRHRYDGLAEGYQDSARQWSEREKWLEQALMDAQYAQGVGICEHPSLVRMRGDEVNVYCTSCSKLWTTDLEDERWETTFKLDTKT